MRLHREIHDGNGPPLLLVHGILSGRAQWRPNLPALSRVARPVVVELWGHGRSPSPEDLSLYHPDAYVAAFDEIREELGADRWFVCGQSLGAALTLRYALDHPERVIAQVWTNSVQALASKEGMEQRRAGMPKVAEAIETGGLAALEKMHTHPMHARRLPAEAKAALLEDAALLDPKGVARTFRATVLETNVRARIAGNRVPTLLVCGEREERFAPHRALAEQTMPFLEVVGTAAGHAVNLEAAEAFDRAMCDFLSRHR